MKFNFLFALLLTGLLGSCQTPNDAGFTTISPMEFSKKLSADANPQLLDVRTPEEFVPQHIQGAKNLDWYEDDFAGKVAGLDKQKPVYVYCMSGGRSKKAASKLSSLGFKEVYELQGGIVKWNSQGLSDKTDLKIGMSPRDYETLIASNKKVLIDFYATWCVPCKQMAPYLEKMQREMTDVVTIVKIDAVAQKSLAATLKIEALPTLLLYENGKLKWKHEGFMSEADLKKQLQ